MAITGGIKFFKQSKGLSKNGSTATASTNSANAKEILNMNRNTQWISIGSDDTTTETITVTLPSVQTINRLAIVDHNLKEFTVTYDAVPTQFTTVIGIDGALGGGIAETVFADDTAYYEFDSVTTDQINITMEKTQIADEEKRISILLLTEELGTFEGFPNVTQAPLNRNIKRKKTLSDKLAVVKGFESFSARMTLRAYPSQDDVTLIGTLHDTEDPFLIWLSGGRRGIDNFRIEQRAWRLKDMYQVQLLSPLRNSYHRNIYISGVNNSLRFDEVV